MQYSAWCPSSRLNKAAALTYCRKQPMKYRLTIKWVLTCPATAYRRYRQKVPLNQSWYHWWLHRKSARRWLFPPPSQLPCRWLHRRNAVPYYRKPYDAVPLPDILPDYPYTVFQWSAPSHDRNPCRINAHNCNLHVRKKSSARMISRHPF